VAITHVNDWYALPVAVRASVGNDTRLIADLHEYAPLEFENRWYWLYLYKPMVDYFLKKYIPSASATITVNEMIAEKYQQEFGFQPKVVMNTPSITAAPPFRLTEFETIRIVHHGYAIPDRRLDLMIDTVAQADSRYVLHLMLLDNGTGYLDRLKKMAQTVAPGRVFFDAPVSPSEIVSTISRFDIGFFLLPHTNFSYKAALPNKFFDFIMAGLAVCVGPSPEMARLVNEFECGVVADSFDPFEVAKLLNSLSAEQIDLMKAKSIDARKALSAEREMDKLLDIYGSVISSQGQVAKTMLPNP
jgi:glycosyltransferase involved in cell wall biosynthesis